MVKLARWRLAGYVVLIAVLASACSSSNAPAADSAPLPPTSEAAVSEPTAAITPTAAAAPTADAAPTAVADPESTTEVGAAPTSEPADITETRLAVLAQPDAELGTYVVAKPGAGRPAVLAPSLLRQPALEIPVYDEPFGEPRTMLDTQEVDEVTARLPLLNWSEFGVPVVLRVLAGQPGDEWIRVQAPTRPHNRSVWVRSEDFGFGFSEHRIEIDIAEPGSLRVFDGGDLVIESGIVSGRDSRPTPVHQTFLQGGIATNLPSRAYGSAILSIASFSEHLGTFGGGGLPSNFLHGTNQPDLMGQRVSSGEIRVPNEVIDEIIGLVDPGTPVTIFDSSRAEATIEAIKAVPQVPAKTTPIGLDDFELSQGVALTVPQLWELCDAEAAQVCLADVDRRIKSAASLASTHLVARVDAGLLSPRISANPVGELRVIPVYDTPAGDERTLIYNNAVDGQQVEFPLTNPTQFGQPLVLNIVRGRPGDEWFLVDAPVLPHGQVIWVRASDFDVGLTHLRIEVDIGQLYDDSDAVGILRVYERTDEVLASKITSGRESRPTSLVATYIEQVLPGSSFGPAYGDFILPLGAYSTALGSFGGGGMPQHAIRGTNQPDTIGNAQSSGSIRVTNDIIEQLAAMPGIVGAPVYMYDSTTPGSTRDAIVRVAKTAAVTVQLDLETLRLVSISFA